MKILRGFRGTRILKVGKDERKRSNYSAVTSSVAVDYVHFVFAFVYFKELILKI